MSKRERNETKRNARSAESKQEREPEEEESISETDRLFREKFRRLSTVLRQKITTYDMVNCARLTDFWRHCETESKRTLIRDRLGDLVDCTSYCTTGWTAYLAKVFLNPIAAVEFTETDSGRTVIVDSVSPLSVMVSEVKVKCGDEKRVFDVGSVSLPRSEKQTQYELTIEPKWIQEEHLGFGSTYDLDYKERMSPVRLAQFWSEYVAQANEIQVLCRVTLPSSVHLDRVQFERAVTSDHKTVPFSREWSWSEAGGGLLGILEVNSLPVESHMWTCEDNDRNENTKLWKTAIKKALGGELEAQGSLE
jgi:hypothetical protein